MRFTSRHVTVATRAMNARLIHRSMACVVALILAVPPLAPAQTAPPPAPFKAEELDQLAAPIALYPDPLVAQILMASTYPLEIVQAARFAKEKPTCAHAVKASHSCDGIFR